MPDMGLEALLSAAKQIDSSLSEELLIQAYRIEKEHQFDKEDQREIPVKLLEKIINDEINSKSSVAGDL